ncbi:adenosine deaminase/editase [Scheffersomyces xylosifermentans]|uniref:adenosine deaminase/editase n=1 Tax=Scheffersomyces xylosifermentans TaxID=1304137 RepID=UPI00315D1B50
MENGEDIAQKIADLVVESFNGLKLKSGKPVVRSNGVKEWTVMASIVAIIDQKDDDIEPKIVPLTMATGVKALPDKIRSYSKGRLVHDLHAEILALRLFNWYLVQECIRIKDELGYNSSVIERMANGEGYKLKAGVSFGLFITEPPCGDSSMQHLVTEKEDSSPWVDEKEPSSKRQKVDGQQESKIDISRGRGNFGKLGIVRTKPGRSDSQITLSKSCSDKLCIKQLLGITNSFSSVLFPEGVFLDYMILQRKKYHEVDMKRCFQSRFLDLLEGKETLHPHPLKILLYDQDHYEFHKPKEKDVAEPSPLSLLYVIPEKKIQVLQNGVRNGTYIKNSLPRKGGESFICNWHLSNQIRSLKSLGYTSYLEFKASLVARNDLKKIGTTTLGNWNPTSNDDFEL